MTSRATASKHGDASSNVDPLRFVHVHTMRSSSQTGAIRRWPWQIIRHSYGRKLQVVNPRAVVPRSRQKDLGVERMRDNARDCLRDILIIR